MTTMNPDIKARWVAALRSGDYQQGTGCLRECQPGEPERFCCLGVLSDLAAKDGIGQWSTEVSGTIPDFVADGHTEDAGLIDPVLAWAGLPADQGAEPRLSYDGTRHWVARLNDGGAGAPQLSFPEIADLIEQQL